MDQASYSKLHGIRPRTLRLWRRQHFANRTVTGEAGGAAPGDDVLTAVLARLAALDAALDAARAALAACRSRLAAAAACRSEETGDIGWRSEPACAVPDADADIAERVLGEVQDSGPSPQDQDGVMEDQEEPPAVLDIGVTSMEDTEPP